MLTYFIVVLVVLAGCVSEGRRTAMRRGLDSLGQVNRNRQAFSVAEADSFARFFDRHGTPDEQLMAKLHELY